MRRWDTCRVCRSPEHAYFPQNPHAGPYHCVELGPSTPVPGQCAGLRSAHACTGCTWCAANVSKEASTLADQAIRDNAIAQLRTAAAAGEKTPFFVGVGLHRPCAISSFLHATAPALLARLVWCVMYVRYMYAGTSLGLSRTSSSTRSLRGRTFLLQRTSMYPWICRTPPGTTPKT